MLPKTADELYDALQAQKQFAFFLPADNGLYRTTSFNGHSVTLEALAPLWLDEPQRETLGFYYRSLWADGWIVSDDFQERLHEGNRLLTRPHLVRHAEDRRRVLGFLPNSATLTLPQAGDALVMHGPWVRGGSITTTVTEVLWWYVLSDHPALVKQNCTIFVKHGGEL